MTTLSKDQILAADDRKREQVDVPEWGGHVFIGTMSSRRRDRFEALQYQTNGKAVELNLQNFRARQAAAIADRATSATGNVISAARPVLFEQRGAGRAGRFRRIIEAETDQWPRIGHRQFFADDPSRQKP